jgi:hypothetical protein
MRWLTSCFQEDAISGWTANVLKAPVSLPTRFQTVLPALRGFSGPQTPAQPELSYIDFKRERRWREEMKARPITRRSDRCIRARSKLSELCLLPELRGARLMPGQPVLLC